MSVSGLRVLRGPDWRGGDTDGGEGHVGTVMELLANHTVRVLWDMGQESTCSTGHDGKYELRVLDSAQIGVRHTDTTCAECGDTDIYGMLWRCQVCAGCDLCPLCYHDDKHDLRHQFLRIDAPGVEGEEVPQRRTSAKLLALGIFPGSKVTRGADWQWGDQDGGEGSEGEVKGYENVSPDSSRDLVQVQWPNGFVNSYRLGFHGYVDLTCVEEEEMGPYYYRDHLPVLDTTASFLSHPAFHDSASAVQYTEESAETPEPVSSAADSCQGGNSTPPASGTDDTSSETPCYSSVTNKVIHEASVTESWRVKDSGIVVDGEEDENDKSSEQTSQRRLSDFSEDHAASTSASTATVATGETTHLVEVETPICSDQLEAPHEAVQAGNKERVTFVEGDKVAIKVSENTLLELLGDHGDFTEELIQEIGETGQVTGINTDDNLTVRFKSGTYTVCPSALVKAANIQIGTTVRIREDAEEVKTLNSRVGWKDEMSATLGKVGRVSNMDSDGDVLVSFGRHHYLFAPACCVPAPDTKPDSLRIESGGKPPRNVSRELQQDNQENGGSDLTGADIKKKNEEMFQRLREKIRSEERGSSFGERGDIREVLNAVTHADHNAVRRMCLDDPSLVEQEHKDVTPLILACAQGTSHIQVVRTLLELGADVNHGLPPFRTPLYACTEGKSDELFELLVDAGADAFAVNDKCRNYLHFASAFGMPGTIRALAARGLDVNIKDDFGNTPLHVAIDHCKEESVASLLQVDSLDLHVRNARDFPALHWAALRDNARALELILARDKSQVDEMFHGKHTPLHIAANNDHDESIRVLVAVGGANVNVQSFPGSGYSPLHLSCVKTRFKATEALLEMGANPNVHDRDGDTPLHLAIGGRHKTDLETPEGQQECQIRIAIACMLISNGAFVDAENHKGRNPLSYGLPPVNKGVRHFMEHNSKLVKLKGGRDYADRGSSHTDIRGNYAESLQSLPLPASVLEGKGGGELKEALKGVELPCGLCGAPRSDVTLLPCQHKCVCKACSVKVTQCPLCDEEVKDREMTGPGDKSVTA